MGLIGYINAIFGIKFDDQLFLSDAKRKLPASLQASSSSSRTSARAKNINTSPSVRANNVGTSQIRETYGKRYENAWQNHPKTHMGENSSRASNDLMIQSHQGSRVLPPSMRSLIPVPNPQYGGPSDLYRPSGVVDEQTVGDERHIYQTALQVLISSFINMPYKQAMKLLSYILFLSYLAGFSTQCFLNNEGEYFLDRRYLWSGSSK